MTTLGRDSMALSGIKAVIYDMDDLMVNSGPLHTQSWNMSLKSYGRSIDELPESVRSDFVGKRIIDVEKSIIKELNLGTTLEEFNEEVSKAFLKLVREKLEAFPGLLDSLKFFKDRGLRIGLASSGTREYIGIVLDKFKIREYFDVIVSGEDVKTGKPDPMIYALASERLGVEPGKCVVLEDAKNGIEAAKSAGCKCIGVIDLNELPQDFSKADMILNSLEEVKGLMLQ